MFLIFCGVSGGGNNVYRDGNFFLFWGFIIQYHTDFFLLQTGADIMPRVKKKQRIENNQYSNQQLDAIGVETTNHRLSSKTLRQYQLYVGHFTKFSAEQVPPVNQDDVSNVELETHIIRFITVYADGNCKLSVNINLILVFYGRKGLLRTKGLLSEYSKSA